MANFKRRKHNGRMIRTKPDACCHFWCKARKRLDAMARMGKEIREWKREAV